MSNPSNSNMALVRSSRGTDPKLCLRRVSLAAQALGTSFGQGMAGAFDLHSCTPLCAQQ